MVQYQKVCEQLASTPSTWLVTGVTGFIGSNLLAHLLKLNQKVVGLDNFATGHQRNLDEVKSLVGPGQWSQFTFIEGDICNLQDCQTEPMRRTTELARVLLRRCRGILVTYAD